MKDTMTAKLSLVLARLDQVRLANNVINYLNPRVTINTTNRYLSTYFDLPFEVHNQQVGIVDKNRIAVLICNNDGRVSLRVDYAQEFELARVNFT